MKDKSEGNKIRLFNEVFAMILAIAGDSPYLTESMEDCGVDWFEEEDMETYEEINL